MAASESPASIELRAERINQLFDALDPSPYPQKDLAQTTEEFIVGWARELPRSKPLRIIVYLPAAEAASGAAPQLSAAFSNYFRYRADQLALDLRELFRIGRWSLLIGVAVLAGCVILGRFLAGRFGEGYFARFFYENLIILGWVANWKPMEIFLYEWWPIVRRQKLYRRLSTASVEVSPITDEDTDIISSVRQPRH